MYSPWIVDTCYLHGKELENAQHKNREYARKMDDKERRDKIKKLQEEIRELKKPRGCNFCSGLPVGPQNLKSNCGSLYGLNIIEDQVFCPKCKMLMAHWWG